MTWNPGPDRAFIGNEAPDLSEAATVALTASLFLPTAPRPLAQGVDGVVNWTCWMVGAPPKGTYLGALRLTLKDGWKTYWRAPGDAGIPPQFDWNGSQQCG